MDDLISRQMTINALGEEPEVWTDDDEYSKGMLAQWQYDKRAIESLSSGSEQKTGEWIPCSERLPDNDDIMLVSCRTKKGVNSVNRAYYADGFWHGSGSMSGVTAWMLLPEPYTKENDRKRN